MVSLNIKKSEVTNVQAHFGRAMPIIFLFLSPTACKRIREILGMRDKAGLWLDVTHGGKLFMSFFKAFSIHFYDLIYR